MILIVMGPPGSGKGTQAQAIVRRRGIIQLSTGDMLRSTIAAGGEFGRQVRAVMTAGDLVGDALVIEIVANRINRPDCAPGFVLDGFPRTLTQAGALLDLLSVRGRKLDGVIDLKVSDDVLVERVAGRFTCANQACHEGYHDRFKPPAKAGTCDRCKGTVFTRRPDDNAETMCARLATYHQQTAPLIGYYVAAGLLHAVEATGSVEQIGNAIDSIVSKLAVARSQAS